MAALRFSLVSTCNAVFGVAVPMVVNCGHLYCADCAAVMVSEKLTCPCGCLVTAAVPNATLPEYLDAAEHDTACGAASTASELCALKERFDLALKPAQAAVVAASRERERFLTVMAEQRKVATAHFAALRAKLDLAETKFLNVFDGLHEERDKSIAARQDVCEMTLNVLQAASNMCAGAARTHDAARCESAKLFLPLLEDSSCNEPSVFYVVPRSDAVFEAIHAGVCTIDPTPIDVSKCNVSGPGIEAHVRGDYPSQNMFRIVARGPSYNRLALDPTDVVVCIDGPDGGIAGSSKVYCETGGTVVVTYAIFKSQAAVNISVQVRGVHLGCWCVSRLVGDEVCGYFDACICMFGAMGFCLYRYVAALRAST